MNYSQFLHTIKGGGVIWAMPKRKGVYLGFLPSLGPKVAMIIIMIFIIISYLLIYSFNDLDSIFNIQKAICNPHSIILHLAIETASDILEK